VFFVFLGVVLADLGFLVSWLVLGLRLHETAAADPSLIERHQIGGLMVCILTVFAHSVTFVYFLGTGLAVKEAQKNWGIGPEWLRETRGFKLKAYPVAMLAIAASIATGILGGAASRAAVPLAVHRAVAIAAIALTAAAFAVALRLMLRNGWMMAVIRGEVAEIRAAAARGDRIATAGDATPELLKSPDQVKCAPSGFLASRACLFLGVSLWVLYAWFWFQHVANGKWQEFGRIGWIPFALVSAPLFASAAYLKSRHPLPADVDF
jgi:hypothetical protein